MILKKLFCEDFSKEKPRKHPNPTPPMLVNEIARLFHARMRAYEMEGEPLKDSFRLIMRELSHKNGCSQLDLVRKTHLKAPTVSVTLRQMEEKGFVRREPDALDMRVIRVYLTEAGQTHNQKIHARLKTVDELLMRGFDREETEQLLRLLERMRDNILPEYCQIDS